MVTLEPPELVLNPFNWAKTTCLGEHSYCWFFFVCFANQPISNCSLWKLAKQERVASTNHIWMPTDEQSHPSNHTLYRGCQPTYGPEKWPIVELHPSPKPYVRTVVCSAWGDSTGPALLSLTTVSNRTCSMLFVSHTERWSHFFTR